MSATDRESRSPAEPITVWLHPALLPAFRAWLDSADLHLYGPMTFDTDDRPESGFMVGIGRVPNRGA